MPYSGYIYLIVVAEKGENSTWDKIPIQMQYIESSQAEDWREMEAFFESSPRPWFIWDLEIDEKWKNRRLFDTDHFVYLGSNF